MKDPTDKEKVLRYLINEGNWLYSYDFIGQKPGVFLSHRGPARISELATKYPELIQTDQSEKTYKYRFRFDNTLISLKTLPARLELFVQSELRRSGRGYEIEDTDFEYTDRNVVRLKRVIKKIM